MLDAFRIAARRLLKSPGFTLLAVLTLAVGVGANTAVFSVVNAVLLRPLPYPDPDRLVLLRERSELFPSGSVAYMNYLDWREGQRSLTDMALYRRENVNLVVSSSPGVRVEPERIPGARTTANLFSIIGLAPRLGRMFTPEEDAPGGPRAVMISDVLWRRMFAAAPDVIGRVVTLDGVERTVVGVMPAAMQLPSRAELWMPLGELRAERNMLNRGAHGGWSVLGRLKPGVTLPQALADLNIIAADLEKKYPDTNSGRSVRMVPLLDGYVGDYRHSLWLLLGAVGGVLLIACANVANLQLARAAGRARELAVRAALGAGRGRITRDLLAESALLAAGGGILGAVLATWSLAAIRALSPPNVLRFQETQMDWTAFAVAAGVALLAGLLAGGWPAWRAASAAVLAGPINEDARGASGGPRRTRAQGLLVVVQVALALVLLTGAGLLIQSLRRAQDEPLGFDPRNVLRVELELPRARYDTDEKRAAFFAALVERAQALPGVVAAAVGNNVPFDRDENDNTFHVTGTPPDELGKEPSAEISIVSPEYFRTLGMPILRGRGFGPQDVLGSPRVIVIDDSLAQRYFPGQDPIGRNIDEFFSPEPNQPPLTIIGVVPRTRNEAPGENVEAMKLPEIYFCVAQETPFGVSLMVRGAPGVDARTLAAAVRREVTALDSAQPATVTGLMEADVERSLAPRRLVGSLLGTFAGLALGLAVIGLYGVLALAVASRTREFGIRLALGAQARAVLALVLREGFVLVAAGLALGLGASLLLARAVQSLLWGVGAFDLPTLLGVILLLGLAALLACWLPARRAARVSPAEALRAE